MAEQNAVATQQGTQVSVAAQVKSMISQDAVKKKFTEVLGQKAPQFLASITNVVAGSAQLKKCPATTIMSAAFVAATYDLPIDSNLGLRRSCLTTTISTTNRRDSGRNIRKHSFR